MNIAIMQNMWVRDAERVQRLIYIHGEDVRRRMVHQFLFSGCLSGLRIKMAFGEDLIRSLHFDEANPKIGSTSNSVFPPDVDHIRRLIDEFSPAVIITFGKVARKALPPEYAGCHISAPHPAARHATVKDELVQAARQYRATIA